MKATAVPAVEHTASSPAVHTGKQGHTAFFGPAAGSEVPFFAPRIQTKLTIGLPGDKYEQEADAVADRVVQRLANPGPPVVVQKKCQDCEEKEKLQRKEEEEENEAPEVMRKEAEEEEEPPPVQAKEKEEEEKPGLMRQAGPEEEEPLQAKAAPEGAAAPSPRLESRLSSAKGAGAPMDKNARQPMEAAFGQDFSRVRIHTDSSATQMNRELNARAFTHGRDIYFNAGEYSPGSTEGRRLLAHELVHVGQQGGEQEQINRKTDGDYSSRNASMKAAGADEFEGDPIKWKYNTLQEALECMAQVETFHNFLIKKVGRYNIWHLVNFVKIRRKWLPEKLLEIDFNDAVTILNRLDRCNSPFNYRLNESDLNASEQLYDLINFFWNYTNNSRNYWGDESTYISLPNPESQPSEQQIKGEKESNLRTPTKGGSKVSNERKVYFLYDRSAINDLLRYFNKKGYDEDVLLKKQKMFSLYTKKQIIYYTAFWAEYLEALKKTKDPRRAAIAYQKLLTTMNIVNRDKKAEGSKGAGLAMLRRRIEQIYRALGKNLSNRVMFGFSGASPNSYFTPEDIGKHSRIPKTNEFNRPGFSHRYGALDIFGPMGTFINARFRKKIYADELPEIEKFIEKIEYFDFKGGEVVTVQKTTSFIDKSNRILSALVIFKKNISSSRYAVSGVGGLRSTWDGIKSLYGSLYLKGTSFHSEKRDPEFNRAVSELLKILKKIEQNIFISASLLDSKSGAETTDRDKVSVWSWLKKTLPYYKVKQTRDWWENYYYKRRLSELMSMKNEKAKRLMEKWGVYKMEYIKDKLRIGLFSLIPGFRNVFTKKQLNEFIAKAFVAASLDYERIVYPFKREARSFAKKEANLKIASGSSMATSVNNMVALSIVDAEFSIYHDKLKEYLEVVIRGLSRSEKTFSTSNKVIIRLDYITPGTNLKLQGYLSYGHLSAVGIGNEFKFGSVGPFYIGQVGTTGTSSIDSHIHLGSWFHIMKDNVKVMDGPSSPLVFLADSQKEFEEKNMPAK